MSGLKACHNCRRRRLKCDRSLPRCQKCANNGHECLGYGRLLRWETGVASRGKMAGRTFESVEHDLRIQQVQSCRPTQQHILPAALQDPLVQDLSLINRKYLSYYASHVCKDLVLYDSPKDNPFRDLVAMSQTYPMLLHIIVANAALHMSNAGHASARFKTPSIPYNTGRKSLGDSQSRWSVNRSWEPYTDALAAKQRALRSLRCVLMDRDSVPTDATLATVLLFTEFELLDSGRDTWTHHISGARSMISALWKPELSASTVPSPLRSCLISTCLVFDIIGSTLTGSTGPTSENGLTSATLSLLQDAEGNHCSSFPAELLDLVQKGAQLMQSDCTHSLSSSSSLEERQALMLLYRASAFDPVSWTGNLRIRSPENDHENREHIAFAHRAAACVYLSRVLLVTNPTLHLTYGLEALVTDIVHHLSFIHPGDALLTASTWPAFIAGAETRDTEKQAWVTIRFQELWGTEPWGLFRGALEVLEGIWERQEEDTTLTGGTSISLEAECKGRNWLHDLRTMGVDWLIV